jgi:hypothetical protein
MAFPGVFHAIPGYDLYSINEVSRGTMASRYTLLLGPDCKLLAKFGSIKEPEVILEEVEELISALKVSPAVQGGALSGGEQVTESPNIFADNPPLPPKSEADESGHEYSGLATESESSVVGDFVDRGEKMGVGTGYKESGLTALNNTVTAEAGEPENKQVDFDGEEE